MKCSADVVRFALLAMALLAAPAPAVASADGIEAPLTTVPGDPARGRAIIVDRQKGLCLLCHTGPFPEQRFQGDLAPDLAGAGSRWTVAELRQRIVDSRAVNPQSIMPAYYRSEGLNRVARAFAGRTILDAQQVEDVVAFLATLRDDGVPPGPVAPRKELP